MTCLPSDMCLPDALAAVSVPEILATAAAAEPKLRKIVLGVLVGFVALSMFLPLFDLTATTGGGGG